MTLIMGEINKALFVQKRSSGQKKNKQGERRPKQHNKLGRFYGYILNSLIIANTHFFK